MQPPNQKIIIEIKTKDNTFLKNIETEVDKNHILEIHKTFGIENVFEYLSNVIGQQIKIEFPNIFKQTPFNSEVTVFIKILNDDFSKQINFEFINNDPKLMTESIVNEITLIFINQFKIDFKSFLEEIINQL